MRQSTLETDHELAELNAASENPDTGVSLAFPDGGKEAWTCLLGSALMMFPSFGFQTASMSHYISSGILTLTGIQLDPSRTISTPTS